MTRKNEKKILRAEFLGKLNDLASENVFTKKDFSHSIAEKGEQSIEKTDGIKNRITDYYVQLYFLS